MSLVRFFYLFSVLILSACSTVKPPLDAVSNSPHSKTITSVKAIKAFTLKGRMAVRDDKDGFSANFYWTQSSPNYYSLQLFGPMGAGNTQIKRTNNLITIKTNKETFHSDNPDELIIRATGYPLPIGSLYYWLRGLSHNGALLSANSKEDGWDITIDEVNKVHRVNLPVKLSITKPPLKIKLKVSSWVIR